MNKKLLTSRWLIAAAACVLLFTLLVGGSVWAQTATVPAAPAIASLTPSDRAITVVWTAPASNGGSDITSYDLRHIRSDAADKSDANWAVEDDVWSSGALQATITGLTNGTVYDVQARAVNAIGNGSWSVTVSGRAATVPGQAGLIASYQDGGISLIYTRRGDGGSPITSFDARYIRADAPDLSDDEWTVLLGISTRGSTYVIEGLTNGVAYHVQVRAVNDVGNGAWSERKTRTPLGPPDPPTIGTVTGSDGALAITWSAPGDDGGTAVTGYNLRYIRNDSSDFAASRWTVVNGIWTSGDLEYTLSGLTNGVRYRLGLQAVNSEGSGEWSDANDPRTGIPGDPPEVPGAPTGIKAYSTGTTVDISWSAPADDGGADITSYDLRYIRNDATDKADANWTVRSSVWTSGARRHAQTGLTAGVLYDFQMRAVNSAGAGSWSATVNNTASTVPGAPAIEMSEWSVGRIRVTWGAPDDDGGAPVTHYDLRHIRGDAADKSDANWTQKDDLTGTSDTITGLTNGVAYDIQVRAVNRAGDGSWSATSTQTPRARPGAPTDVWVGTGNGQLTANWSPPAAVTGATIGGYRVRHIVRNAPGSGLIDNWTSSGLISSESRQYDITGLENGTRYWVWVRAVNEQGDESTNGRITAWYIPGSPPGGITNLRRTSTQERDILIDWTGPTDDGGIGISHYDIHHYPTGDPSDVTETELIADDHIVGLPADHSTWVGGGALTPHVEYKIMVRARNAAGGGPWSSLTVIPRRTPVNLTIDSVTPGDGSLTVSWTDGGDDEITAYELRYTSNFYPSSDAPDSSAFEYVRGITGTSPLEHTITGLDNGVRYAIQVRGRNRYGELSTDWGRWRPLFRLGTGAENGTPRTTPDAPSIGSVTPGDRVLTVSWSAPAEDGGARVTHYKIRHIRSDATDKSDGNWTVDLSVGSSGVLRDEIDNLTNGVQYDVQVRAANRAGDGPWSATRTGTPLTRPGAPSVDSVTPGDETLAVAWSAPASNGGRDITSYDLRYIRSDAPNKADANWTERDGIWTSGALRHVLSGLTNGVDYDVQVRAVNAVGNGAWSGTGAGKPLTTPGAPTIDSVTPGDETLTMSWSAPADTGGSEVTGYDLRYIRSDAPSKSDANWTERDGVWSSGVLQYTVSGLTNGVRYDLQVRGVNEAGDGRWSGAISGAPQTIPAAPTIDSVTPGDETLTVAWSAPADTGGSTVEGYDARYIRSDAADKSDDSWTERDGIWTSGSLEYTLSGLANGVRYDVQLRAVTSAGNGPWSAPTSATPQTAPDAPTINLITVGDGALAVSWSAPSDNGGSAITSYDARYIRSDAADKSDDSWTERDGIWTSGILRYTVDSLTNGVGYDVQVRAVNVAGDGSWSATASATPQTVTDAPTVNLITPGDGALTVSWSAPSDTGGSAIASYDLRYIRSDALDRADDRWTVRDGIWTSGDLEYTLSGLTNGVGYDVQVRAVNDAGDGPWSASATDTPRTTPGAPTIDVVSPGNYALSITWSAPADDGGSAITSYDLRYIRSDATDKSDDSWTVREDIWSSGPLQYGLNEAAGFDLSGGVRYDVQVRAVNAVADGPWSASETGTPRRPFQPVTAPGAPASLVATPGDGSLSIAWSPPADDGGADVTSYDLRYILSDATDRSDDNWTVEDDVWSSGAREYTLDGLTNGDRYDLQVRAVNEAGNGPWSVTAAGIEVGATANVPPEFTEGDSTTRSVAENATAGADIGAPVEATDADDDVLTYTLGGADAASFDIDASNGQLSTKSDVDAETSSEYTVEVTATDPSDATDVITVTIIVIDVSHDCAGGGAVADAADNPGLVSDCVALLASRDKLAGSGATRSLNWADDAPISGWYGVVLSGTPQRVTKLRLHGQNTNSDTGTAEAKLNGTVPAELGRLSELTALYLHRNNLTGEVPGALGNLTNLEWLSLYSNDLTGGIPTELADLSNLRRLYLNHNDLTGQIPGELGTMSSLTHLFLHRNNLTGTIPADRWDGLDNLVWLSLYGNDLTGGIPTELTGLAKLQRLYLHENRNLGGTIPAELGGMSSLTHLLLLRTGLSGSIPDALGDLSNLEWLSLYNNDLSGEIPGELGSLAKLQRLYLHYNDLTGEIPSELGDLGTLTNLWLNDNDLDGDIPASLENLTNLERWRLRNNGFTGCVPAGLAEVENNDFDSLGLEVCASDDGS